MTRCTHQQLHYMGKGPLPETNPECRWNYVCRKCRRWIKYKEPITLDAEDWHGRLPKESYISEANAGLGHGVPWPTPAPKKAVPKRKAKRVTKPKRAKAKK